MKLLVGLLLGLACAGTGWADRYVSLQGANDTVGQYTNWAGAATNLHAAVAVATNGETVWISNGTFVITGQVTVVTNIIIKGAFGRDATVLAGGFPELTNRCFTLDYNSAWLDSLTLSNFYAYNHGGAVYLSRGNIINCLFTHNQARAGYWGAGIYAVYTWSGLVANCEFRNATNVTYGGGIGINGGIGTVRFCDFYDNYAVQGGAVFLNGNAIVENCIMRNNTGSLRGGAVASSAANQGVLRNSLLTGNVSAGGGGVWIGSNSFSVVNCSIVSNYSGGGGGIRFDNDSTAGEIYKVINCIVFSNQLPNILLAPAAVQTNWFFNSCVGGYNLPSSQGNKTDHPLFVNADPANADYHLQPNSPCVNAGTNHILWVSGALDLDGRHRIDMFSGVVDMGAFEYLPKGFLFTAH